MTEDFRHKVFSVWLVSISRTDLLPAEPGLSILLMRMAFNAGWTAGQRSAGGGNE